MSALADKPDDFLNWARHRGTAIGADTFAPRMLYGEYLRDLLEQAIKTAAPHVRFKHIDDQVVDVRPHQLGGRQIVMLRGRTSIVAKQVVLALGNFMPGDPPIADRTFYASSRYVRDPWGDGALDTIKATEPVLMIGTGLTMIDVALALRHRGHHAPIHALSRRGLLPQPHRSPTRPPAYRLSEQDVDGWEKTALGLLRHVRRDVQLAARAGDDWRDVINALRPVTQPLWRSLGQAERRRFLRHLRSFWETHRHRVASEPAVAVRSMIAAGLLVVRGGRLRSLTSRSEAVEAAIQVRGSDRLERIEVGHVINATGPETDLSRIRDPLVESLRKRGLIRSDSLSLGLDADEEGTVITAGGDPHPALSVIGSLRRGQLWESTAVPELRVQAAELAARLRARLGDRPPLRRPDRVSPVSAQTQLVV